MSTEETTALEETRKRLAGRPSKYNPDIGLKIVQEMEKGYSLAAAAAAFDIARKTIYNWKDEHPEFDELVQIAMVKRQRFLEERLTTTQSGAVVTSTMFALKNAGAQDWRDKQDIELTGANGGAIETAHTQTARLIVDTNSASIEQLEMLKQIAMQKTEE
jgi:hypothetical protein